MNAASRLRENEYGYPQYDYTARRNNLRVLEDADSNRNNYDGRTSTKVYAVSRSNVFMYQMVGLVAVLLLFLIAIGFAGIQMQISEVERDINRLNNEVYQLSTDNNMMQSIIATATNIETIRQNAAMLGMGKPNAENIEYVSESAANAYTMSSKNLGN